MYFVQKERELGSTAAARCRIMSAVRARESREEMHTLTKCVESV
jgi:hypothetical protein